MSQIDESPPLDDPVVGSQRSILNYQTEEILALGFLMVFLPLCSCLKCYGHRLEAHLPESNFNGASTTFSRVVFLLL